MAELEFHPVADIFPMMSEREFADLAADIAEHGLREPVWLHRDGRIIDGRNRYRACRQAGLPCEFRGYEGDDNKLVSFVVSLNLHRRHLSESQRAMVGDRIANLAWGERSDRAANLPVSQAQAADLVNVSERSIRSAHKVRESGVPELAEKVMADELAVSTAAEIARAPESEQRRVIALDDKDAILAAAKEIKRERIALARERQPEPVAQPVLAPDGKYSCIVIDPPWPMQKIEREERPDQGSSLDYPVMSLEDIANEDFVPVRSLASDDCHIYLWVTHKFLPAGLDLLTGWGFNYQCVMTWRKNVGITPFSWMYDTEHVLFGRRGNLKLERLGLRLSFEAPVQGHSVKPDVFYNRVLEASPGPRVEMFARRPRDGFTVWGNEVADVV